MNIKWSLWMGNKTHRAVNSLLLTASDNRTHWAVPNQRFLLLKSPLLYCDVRGWGWGWGGGRHVAIYNRGLESEEYRIKLFHALRGKYSGLSIAYALNKCILYEEIEKNILNYKCSPVLIYRCNCLSSNMIRWSYAMTIMNILHSCISAKIKCRFINCLTFQPVGNVIRWPIFKMKVVD